MWLLLLLLSLLPLLLLLLLLLLPPRVVAAAAVASAVAYLVCRNCWLLLPLLHPPLLHAKVGPRPAFADGRAACEAREAIFAARGEQQGGQGTCVAFVLQEGEKCCR